MVINAKDHVVYLTGSRAIECFFPNFRSTELYGRNREDISKRDWDIVGEGEKKEGIEYAPDGLFTDEVCQTYASDIIVETPVGMATVVNPVGIMLMKRSHLHRPIGFEKHIRDYHFLKERIQSNLINDEYFTLLKKRTKATKDKYGDKHPSLKQNKKEFFDDYVKKVYEHDDIHYAVAYYDEPIYEKLKLNQDTVFCEKDLWNNLSHDDKIKCVREEMFVIALERFLIPDPRMPAKFATDKSLFRICTNLTSGWFRDFAIDNWPEIRNYEYDFVGKFLEAGFELGKV